MFVFWNPKEEEGDATVGGGTTRSQRRSKPVQVRKRLYTIDLDYWHVPRRLKKKSKKAPKDEQTTIIPLEETAREELKELVHQVDRQLKLLAAQNDHIKDLAEASSIRSQLLEKEKQYLDMLQAAEEQREKLRKQNLENLLRGLYAIQKQMYFIELQLEEEVLLIFLLEDDE
jgi:endo-alpha-1,4-polygalactosaminidase (GH114 family)